MATAGSGSGGQRTLALALLFATGIACLPVVAAFLDGESTDQLIVPVLLAVMAVVGAIVGYLLPGITGGDTNSARSAGVGALVGVAGALVGLVLFSLLL